MGIRQTFDPPQEGGLSPVVRFDAGTVLAKLEAAGLLARGRVHLISVAAVRDAFGSKWEERKSLVWDMAEAQILKRIGQQDFSARISDVDFAVITPKLEPADAQLLAVRLSRDILHHFLGKSHDEAIIIKIVTAYADQQITCRQVLEKELGPALRADYLKGFKRPAAVTEPSQAGEVITADGSQLRFSSSVDPIIDLNRWAVAGHRIEPKITYERSGAPLTPAARRQLLPRDVEDIDIATLNRGLRRLDDAQNASTRTTLILSVSFLTVSNTRSRSALFAIAQRAKYEMQKSVIWEITDFDGGVPAGRLHECIAQLSAFSRAVFARAEAATLSAISDKSTGRCGLIFQPSQDYEDEDDASAWLLSTSRIASKRSATLIAANLPSKDLLPLASSLGFTHATVRQVAVR